MPAPYLVEIMPQRRRISVTARGKSSFQLAKEAIGELTRDPRFDAQFTLLVDLREIDYLPSSAEAEGFAEVMGVFRNRIALVASREVNFGLARMVSIYSQLAGLEIEAFADLESAEQWLDESRTPPGA